MAQIHMKTSGREFLERGRHRRGRRFLLALVGGIVVLAGSSATRR